MKVRVFTGPISFVAVGILLLSFSSLQAEACDCKKQCPLDTALPAESGAGAQLDADEAKGLALMREEEKLARDVYAALYDKWQLPIFAKLGSSEQKHMDAAGRLVAYYGQPDPVVVGKPGAFVSAKLQHLYDEFVERGNKSLQEALRVGAAIEEIDIIDLEERLAQTQQEPMQLVYGNLLRASHNHLRAFAKQIHRRSGREYAPQYLSVDAYAQIVSAAAQEGHGGPNN